MLASAHALVRLDFVTSQPAPTDSKQLWRTWAKEVRSALPIQEVSGQAARYLTAWQPFQNAEHVLIYLAFGSEIDLAPLTELDKTFYVTRTWETDRNLTVHRLDGGLEPHPYGYSQPASTSSKVRPEKIDLALIPGLCFDERGTRLGYGRGYYDRLLPKLRSDIPFVGVTADALVAPKLPKDPSFDVPMTHLVTEMGVKPL